MKAFKHRCGLHASGAAAGILRGRVPPTKSCAGATALIRPSHPLRHGIRITLPNPVAATQKMKTTIPLTL
jgi:hypothetical protein